MICRRPPRRVDLDGLPDQREGHRVAIGLEADQLVVGHAPRLAAPPGGSRAGRRWRSARRAPGRSGRPAARGSCRGCARRRSRPATGRAAPEVLLVDEAPPGQEVALDVLHARLDLALGLRAVGAAELRLEAPVVGELLEGRRSRRRARRRRADRPCAAGRRDARACGRRSARRPARGRPGTGCSVSSAQGSWKLRRE